MPDREKVIKGLESLRDVCIAKSDMAIGEGRTAWASYASVVKLALDLLREQEKTKVVFRQYDGSVESECGNCGLYLDKTYSACPKCGKELDWNA